jgi:hypothetical protein
MLCAFLSPWYADWLVYCSAYTHVFQLYTCECFWSRLNPLAQRATTVPMEWIICRARLSNIRRGTQKQIQTLGCCWEFISWITRRKQTTGTLASSEHTHYVMDVRALWSSQGPDCWCKTHQHHKFHGINHILLSSLLFGIGAWFFVIIICTKNFRHRI